mgnify:CR=1 FL=1
MAYATTQSRTARFPLAEIVRSMLADWRHYRARRNEEARVLAELDAMSDAELADIGLCRLQLADIAREAAWGK